MKKTICLLVIVVIGILILSGCSSVTKIAIMTKLESGSLVGISEIDSAKLYLEINHLKNVEIIPFDDGWDPDKIQSVYEEIRKQGIDIIITSHTSSCALKLQELVKQDKDPVIVFVTGATTDKLSGSNDVIYRVIQDVHKEQKNIAEYIAQKKHKNLLIVRDTTNPGYTDPALTYFTQYYPGVFNAIDLDIVKFNSSTMEQEMKKYPFDALYLMVGGYQTNSGVVAQIGTSINPDVRIYYTPWMKTPNILDTAGNSILQSVMPSHYPPRGTNQEIDTYRDQFVTKYGYVPTFISLNVYKAMDLVHQNIKAGHSDPQSMKKNIDLVRTFRTPIGVIEFDAFGDTDSILFYIEDIKKEFE